MKTLILPFILLIYSFIFSSCSKETSTVNSPEPETDFSTDSLTLVNTTFENAGMANLQGWKFSDPIAANYFLFSNDVDSNGGLWSLMAIPDTIQYIYLIYKGLSSSKVSQIVHFSFDLKTIGDISADIHCYVWSHSQAFGWDVSCSVYRKWSAVTKNWPLTYSQVDSITIYYGVHGGNVGDYALIDNIKLEIRPQ